MRVGVGERAQAVVVLLAGRIPQGQLHVLAIDLDIGDVVFEDGGDVDLYWRERIRLLDQLHGDNAAGRRVLQDAGGLVRVCQKRHVAHPAGNGRPVLRGRRWWHSAR